MSFSPKLPENIDVTEILQKINKELSYEYGKTVEIDLELLRTINVISAQ